MRAAGARAGGWAAAILAAALLLSPSAALAQPGTATPGAPDDTAAANAAAVRAAFDAWAAGTGSVFELLAEDATWTVAGHSPVSGRYTSRRDFLARAVQPITARLATSIVPRLHHLLAQGDAVVAVFDGVATARDGRPYRNTYAWHMTLDGGRIVRVTAFLDTWALEALMQD